MGHKMTKELGFVHFELFLMRSALLPCDVFGEGADSNTSKSWLHDAVCLIHAGIARP